MSIGQREYECICGGRILESWSNDSLKLECSNNCRKPYSQEAWAETQKLIDNGTKYRYRGVDYFKCGNYYYCEVTETNNKTIYNSFEDEKLARKWIDDNLKN